MNHGHINHSHLVKTWEPRVKINRFGRPIDEKWQIAERHALVSPHPGYTVSITFAPYVDHPEWVRVTSVNWRCEDEPNGVVSLDECRAFYRKLLAAGFVRG